VEADLDELQRLYNARLCVKDPARPLLFVRLATLVALQDPLQAGTRVPNDFLRIINYPARLLLRHAQNLAAFVLKELAYVVMVCPCSEWKGGACMVAAPVLDDLPLLRLDLDSGLASPIPQDALKEDTRLTIATTSRA
jgi:hypothetical protein